MRCVILASCIILLHLSSAFYIDSEQIVCSEREKCGEASVDESEMKTFCSCENGLKCYRPNEDMLDFYCMKSTNLQKVVFSRFGRR